jgi:hypothetical protein
MRYQIVPVTPFEQNCTLFWCENTRQAVVIDPGGDIERILRALEDEKLTLAKILVTHGHIDHAGGVAALVERCAVPVEGPHEEDRFWIDGMPQQSKMFGFPNVRSFVPTRWLQGATRCSSAMSSWMCCTAPDTRRGMLSFSMRPAVWLRSATCCFKAPSAAPISARRPRHADPLHPRTTLSAR